MNKENIVCYDCIDRIFKCYEMDTYRREMPSLDFNKGEVSGCPITASLQPCYWCEERKAYSKVEGEYMCDGCKHESFDRSLDIDY